MDSNWFSLSLHHFLHYNKKNSGKCGYFQNPFFFFYPHQKNPVFPIIIIITTDVMRADRKSTWVLFLNLKFWYWYFFVWFLLSLQRLTQKSDCDGHHVQWGFNTSRQNTGLQNQLKKSYFKSQYEMKALTEKHLQNTQTS